MTTRISIPGTVLERDLFSRTASLTDEGQIPMYCDLIIDTVTDYDGT